MTDTTKKVVGLCAIAGIFWIWKSNQTCETTDPSAASAEVANTAEAAVPFYKIRQRIERESCGETIGVNLGWSGEYPGRVVQITQPVTLEARSGPCSFGTVSCTLQPGLYHPWTKDKNINPTAYVSVAAKTNYKAESDISISKYVDGQYISEVIPAGTLVEFVVGLGEMSCRYRVDGETFDHDCPGEYGETALKKVRSKKNKTIGSKTWKMLAVECSEGHAGWFKLENALFRQSRSVLEGAMTGWQEIGPHGSQGI